jgi:hypothetical protein
MNKRIIAFALVLMTALSLVACSGGNEYKLSYTSDGSDKVDYIYYTEERVVYVIGGIMMVNVDGEPTLLEMALDSNELTIEAIIESAKNDYENGDLDCVIYPDGSCEYSYEGFKMIVLNTHLRNVDVYFVPSSMGFYDVYHK